VDSRRWLVALGALLALLAAALVGDLLRGGPEARGGRIFPSWDPRRVLALRIERPGRPAIALARDGASWRLREPVSAPADPAAVADLLGSLEIMAARQHAGGRVADPILSVRVERSGEPPVTLDLARDTGKTDRLWISRRGEDGRALIDGYLARALDVSADDLRERRPFHGRLAGVTRILLAAGTRQVVLEGKPWRIDQVRADPDKVNALLAALERLRATSFLDRAPAVSPTTVGVIGKAGATEIALGGRCEDDGLAATTPLGPVCLPAADADGITSLLLDERALQDRRLLPRIDHQIDHARISAGDRSITIDDMEVVQAWATRFDAAADPDAEPVPADGLRVSGRVEIDGVDGAHEQIDVVRTPRGKLAVRRAGEPVAFLLADPGAVDPDPKNYRSLDLISADPTALISAQRDGEEIARGELLEEWRAVSPRGATVDTAAAEALAATVAALRAVRVAPDRSHRATVTLTVELAPPPGESAAIRHRIDLASGATGRCTVRLDGDPTTFELSPDTCAALQRPWTRR
jgi:hypothetical protein